MPTTPQSVYSQPWKREAEQVSLLKFSFKCSQAVWWRHFWSFDGRLFQVLAAATSLTQCIYKQFVRSFLARLSQLLT